MTYRLTRCPGCGAMRGVNGSTCKPTPRDASNVKPMTSVDALTRDLHGRRSTHRRSPEALVLDDSRIDRSGGPEACWPWTGARSGGYGMATKDGVFGGAHRFVLAEALGQEIPVGMVVCHSCDNPPCCNPAHLFLGTQADNMRDALAKGRMFVPHRPDHPPYRLTDGQLQELRALAGSMTRAAIAERFGVSPSFVKRVLRSTP